MTLLRWFLGTIILSVDFITRPKPIVRNIKKQNKINKLTSNLSLYQFNACPFCVRVRRKIRKYSLNIEYRDAKNNKKHKNDLKNLGGKLKVPCLRIKKNNDKVEWLYESKDIINYLIKDLELENNLR